MRKKFVILTTCLIVAVSNVLAKSLVLTLPNGKRAYYLLGEKDDPMLRFVDGNIIVNTDKYEFDNVKNFYISSTDDPSGVENVIGDMIRYDNNKVIFDAEKSLSINIYTLDGREINAHTQQTNDKVVVDLNTLSQGTYVITIGDTSLKIHKK